MHNFKNKLRSVLLSVAILILLSPALSFGFGVGGLQLDSTLNQKLDASIELIGVQEGEASSIVVDLAPNAIYARMGIEQTPALQKLKFSLEKTPEGAPYIHVFTDEVITEPFLNFLVEVNWSHGRLLREFTLLLDPPVLLDEKATAIEAPQADLPPTFTVTTDSPDSDIPETIKAAKLPDQEPEETLESEVEPEISEILEEILASENLNDTENLETLSEEINEPISEPEIQQPTSLVHEKVQQNEILWHIAEKMRPENISVEQMMLALQRENPNAFFRDNVSFLKAGAVLRIEDTSTLNQISVEDAIDEISRQHQSWLDYRSERQARNAVAAESAATPKQGGNGTTTPDTSIVETIDDNQSEVRLKLVSPIEEENGDTISQTNAVLEAATEKLSQLNIELAIATEAVEAGKHENEELLNRLAALEEQMSAMQSLIQLKDAELQRLQGDESIGEQEFLKPIVVDTQIESEPVSVANDVEVNHEKHQSPSLFSDPITIAAGIFAIILLSLLVWFVRGRKTKTVEREELVYSDEKQKSLDELFPEESIDSNDSETSVIKFNESKAAEPDSEIGVEPLTEISFEHSEMLDSNESLLDPIAEADVYLTYEKYNKAEALLHDAIESDPDRQELKLKLLEVYALSRNIKAFDKQAEELFAAVGGLEDNILWQHAQLMAKDIATTSPLFTKDKVKDDVHVSTIEKALSASWSPEQVTEFDAEQDKSTITNSELEIGESEISAAEVIVDTDQVANTEERDIVKSDEVIMSDASLDEASKTILQDDKVKSEAEPKLELEPEPKTEAVVSDAELEKAMDAFTESALDKEWDESAGEEVNEIVNEAIENAATFSTHPAKAGSTGSDTSMFLLSDEVGTKLDLAKAYIEMGDQEGAFDLLGEVLEEGTTQQKTEAKELMESH